MKSWQEEDNKLYWAEDPERLRPESYPLISILSAMIRSALDWEVQHGRLLAARENARRDQDGSTERE